ncbi:MAG: uracil-DNA glycosylase [Anaerolineales bacterium]|nr:uracil-DNA glycosylase [Anaerolineales bacterium]
MSLENLNQEIISCRKCPRLVKWREEISITKRRAYLEDEYWGKPVPGFGDPGAKVLVVGLAPGAHGSNRTGRQFTGDASGDFLFPALHRAGFASQPLSTGRDDGLILNDMYITASGRCAPPRNKPTAQELDACQPYLECELELLRPRVVVVLGRIAFDRILKIYSARKPGWKFAHGAAFQFDDGAWLLCSYHPSRQNTQTGRLTVEMFDQVWTRARQLLEVS